MENSRIEETLDELDTFSQAPNTPEDGLSTFPELYFYLMNSGVFQESKSCPSHQSTLRLSVLARLLSPGTPVSVRQ